MKFNQELYNNYQLPKHIKYYDLFEFPEDIQKVVTFQDNKKLPIYRWFPYKQGYSKFLVERIINNVKLPKGSKIYDPFVGSGTTAVTALLNGYIGLGSDQLPLGKFITETKMKALSLSENEIRQAVSQVLNSCFKSNKKWPNVQIIDKTIPQKTQQDLMNYREIIHSLDISIELKELLLLAFSSSIDKCSYIKKDGGFPRIKKDKKLEVLTDEFQKNIDIFIQDINNTNIDFKVDKNHLKESKIFVADARNTGVEDNSIDLLITSPPYLNKTDYTRVYSLELCYMFIDTFDDIRDLRYKSFSGHVEAKRIYPDVRLPKSINERLDCLKKEDLSNPKHPDMAEGYFQDLYYSLQDNYRYVKKGAISAWVVWNSRLSGVHFPVDIFLAEIAEEIGFKISKIECIRLTGTSAQQVKKYGEQPLRESIIYLEKPL